MRKDKFLTFLLYTLSIIGVGVEWWVEDQVLTNTLERQGHTLLLLLI